MKCFSICLSHHLKVFQNIVFCISNSHISWVDNISLPVFNVFFGVIDSHLWITVGLVLVVWLAIFVMKLGVWYWYELVCETTALSCVLFSIWETEIKASHLLLNSWNVYENGSGSGLKWGAENSFLVSHMDYRDSDSWDNTAASWDLH